MNDHIAFFVLICLILFLQRSHQQKLALLDETVVQAPNFTPNSPSNVSLNDRAPETLSNNNLLNSTSGTAAEHHSRTIEKPQVLGVDDTAVIIQWTYDIGIFAFRTPNQFVVEFVEGKYSEEYREIDRFDVDFGNLEDTRRSQSYNLRGLNPTTWYRLRVVPILTSGPGFPSEPLTFTTLRSPINYWEPLLPRRSSLLSFGRGFSDPVQDRPHLSPGVEIFENQVREKELPLWFSDAPTRENPELPSGRRGHTMTLIGDQLLMFGGRTNGISFDMQ
jgi:hypothetical protein